VSPETPLIEVDALYVAATKRGLVQVRVHNLPPFLITPAKAREVASFLLEAAGAAEGDEALMKVLERISTPEALIGQVLMALRIERAKIDERARTEARRAVAEDQINPDLSN